MVEKPNFRFVSDNPATKEQLNVSLCRIWVKKTILQTILY